MKQSHIVSTDDIERNQRGKSRKWIRNLVLGISVFLFGAVAILAIMPAAFPAVGATIADLLRETFGPQPVAMLESISSRLHDTLSRHLYKGNAPQIQWSASTPWNQTHSLSQSKVHGQLAPSSAAKSSVIIDAPQIGWQAYGPLVNGSYVLARTLITPDSYRPYAGVALVRMDLSRLQLHMMPGYQEPSHSAQVVHAIPDLALFPLPSTKT